MKVEYRRTCLKCRLVLFIFFCLCNQYLLFFSRDKSSLHRVVDKDRLSVIVRLAGLVSEEEALKRLNQQINYDGKSLLKSSTTVCEFLLNDGSFWHCNQNELVDDY